MNIKERWLEVHAKLGDLYYELRPRKKYKADTRGILTKLKKRIEAFRVRSRNEDAVVVQVDRTVEASKDVTTIPVKYTDKLELEFLDMTGSMCTLQTAYINGHTDVDALYKRFKSYIMTHSKNRMHRRDPQQKYRIVRSLYTVHTQDVELFEMNYSHTNLNLEDKLNEKSI
jgi:hypothetical protein